MGLSASEKATVKGDWAKVEANMDTHGPAYYQKLLGENPSFHPKFTKFASVKVADFPGNQEVLSEAKKTLIVIGKCVGWMDSPADMQKRMAALSRTHKAMSIGMKEFDIGFAVVLDYLKGALGLDGAGVTAWTNFVNELKAALATNY